jgi:choline dehydrogenase-like flavoprotein
VYFSKKEFDAIVVGSGPGGASVAQELSQQGKSVLILEWGNNNPVKGNITQFLSGAMTPFKSLLITGQVLGMIRGITAGGSSMYYAGTAFDPPVDMLSKYDIDITDEIAQIRKEVPTDVLSDELMSPAGQTFFQSANELGYDVKKLNKFIYQDKCKAGCQKCTYGCPDGAKWNARNFVDKAIDNGSMMITKAKVSKVIIENNKAIGVEYTHGKETYRAYAPNVIISAGGIGSPQILSKSGVEGVGKDFFFDPLIFVSGKVQGIKTGRGVPMSAGIHMPDEGIVMTDFNLPHLLKIAFDLELFRFKQAFSYSNIVPIMVKVKDGLGGTVKSGARVWKTLQNEDKRKLDKGAAHAKRILENAGATDITRSWVLAAHPGGTVKIGESIDSNLKTKVDNLYVCDCSVIPEPWGLPPTFTLLALGKRLSKHIINSN